ncbi:hypothetical protein HBI49_023470 [Parastagonospora nodorum]|nr:hypothetical protein HBH50_076100 [Parastagonospora nodorum]KAH4093768.1 hypothetical protein HBH48_064350 [Parastagonospora nodorum]KAH4609294.1 hypothetical protein HBH82_064220 [Parastagonospora nodorum]KAH4711650.1 hypothetical protein HBH67_026510 [Parastagonospora nodorum]KAH4718590.1 hypothetical protein HBH78_030520 [Parastagonospora nodorum]
MGPRSRVKFHGHEMKKKRNHKAQVKVQKQTKVALADQKQVSSDNTAIIELPTRPACPIKVPSFAKKRVTSTEEIAHSGNFKSKIRAKASSNPHGRPASDDSAIFDDLYDSPPESLIIQAPIYREVDGRLEIQRPNKSVTEEPKTDTSETSASPSSFIKTLVTLFAGRRQSPPKSDNGKHHFRSQSVPTPVKNIDHDNVENPRRAQSEYTPTPPLAPPTPPRLTHAQVIPAIMRRVANEPSHVRRPREIFTAPLHKTTGGAVVFEDVFTPTEVQRGFHVPSATQTPEELEQCRTKSSSTLLDRNEDVWGRWHAKYEKRETHPFNRPAAVPA